VLCRFLVPEILSKDNVANKLVDVVNSAIGCVISDSPTLQAGITGEDSSKPSFIELGVVDLDKHVEWRTLDDSLDNDHQTQATVASQLDTRFFDLDIRPGWRVLVMQHVQTDVLNILFVWNHPHGDGMGGKVFHQLLLEALQQRTKTHPERMSSNLTLKVPDTSKAFPPATETLVRLSTTPLFVLKEAWDDYKPPSLFPKATRADWAPIRTLPYKSQFHVFSLPNNVLSKVLSTCRAHSTTLTGLLNSLALFSLASRIDEEVAPAFASSTAIDQRRFLPSQSPDYPWFDPKTAIANYVSIMTHEYDIALVANIRSKHAIQSTNDLLSEESLNLLWLTAARVRSEIQTRLEMGVHNDTLGLARFVPNWKKQFLSDVKKPRKLSWFVTNLGVFEGTPAATEAEPKTVSWSIQRAQFTLSTEIPVAALLIGVASVKDEGVVVTCTWQDTVVEAGLVKQVMADLERWLRQVADA
jgi:hypothetical protein